MTQQKSTNVLFKPAVRTSFETIFITATIETPLGTMITISNETHLYLLEFIDKKGLAEEIEKLQKKCNASIFSGSAQPISSICNELHLYFAGLLTVFKTPIYLIGSQFQKMVWHELDNTPYGHTRTYRDQAKAIGNERAYRAVANANSKNHLAIIIPCHRIISSQGTVGGYSGGIARKQWLLNHEKVTFKK